MGPQSERFTVSECVVQSGLIHIPCDHFEHSSAIGLPLPMPMRSRRKQEIQTLGIRVPSVLALKTTINPLKCPADWTEIHHTPSPQSSAPPTAQVPLSKCPWSFTGSGSSSGPPSRPSRNACRHCRRRSVAPPERSTP